MNIQLYQRYKKAEAYLESVANVKNEDFFKNNVDPAKLFARAKFFLHLAGHPDKDYKIIHVAGTSGKGSTVNYISQILIRAGYKVGTHYSPYVSVSTEKIQINGKLISAEDFIALVEELKPLIEKCTKQFETPSFFECSMIAALLYFQKQKVDYVVLEVGCGGRFDASNAVLKTELSIITSIGLDHVQMLGDTVEKIAFEKAGIIRPHGEVLTAATQPSVIEVIQKVCHEKKANLEIIKTADNPNKAIARRVAERMGIAENIIEKSLKQITAPARFEIMQTGPLVILDGAHNEDKVKFFAKKLVEKISNSKHQVPNSAPKAHSPLASKIHLICALTENREPEKIFKSVKPLADFVYATRFLTAFRKCTPPDVLARAFRGKKVETFLDPEQALDAALKRAKANDIIAIVGSFYLASDIRGRWIDEVWQLEHQSNFKR
jgi:dihydrofolate synthase/folylpolyglutamate synthase